MTLRIPGAAPTKLFAFPVPTVGTRARALDIATYPRLAHALGLNEPSSPVLPAPVRIELATPKLH